MFSVKKGASTCLKQIRRSTATVGANVAKKSTSTVNIDQNSNFADKQDSAAENNSNFSNTISFSSPESDFTTPHILIKSNYVDLDNHVNDTNVEPDHPSDSTYSGQLSFTSPEADFTSGSVGMYEEAAATVTAAKEKQQEQQEIKLAKDTFFQKLEEKSEEHGAMAYSLSYATPESDFSNPTLEAMLTERQKKQLQNTTLLHHENANQLSSTKQIVKEEVLIKEASNEYEELRAHADLLSHEDPLPTSMEEAIISNEAVVITEPEVPFKIVTVNSAWENLCGYTKDECSGQTLDCIQGPETNEAAITALMSQLLRGEEAGTVLVNYKKDGSKFLNRLRVGALRDDNNSITHFVGVLKEVEEMTDHFNGASKIFVQD